MTCTGRSQKRIAARGGGSGSESPANKRIKLTGAAILVSRGMKVLKAAPAAYPYRSAKKDTPEDAEVRVGAVLLPPDIVAVNGPLVFLAGPIQGAPDWQAEAIGWFHTHAPHLAIASPRREYPPDAFDYAAQVDWETNYLRRAAQRGVILFWLAREAVSVPGRCYGQTSRFELAEWKARHERDGIQLVVGVEQGFSGARYIRHRFGQDCPMVPLVASLEEACYAVLELMRAEPEVPPDCGGMT